MAHAAANLTRSTVRTAGWLAIVVSLAGAPSSAWAEEPLSASEATEQSAQRDESKPLRRDRATGRSTSGGAADASSGGSWLRTSASLAGVVALVVFLAWGYRSVTGNTRSLLLRSRRNSTIELLGRTQLSPRQSVCLLRVGSRAVLVGVSGDGIRTLDVITDAAAVAQLAGQATTTARDAFDACLKSEQREFEAADASQSHDDLAASTLRALAAKQKLTSAADRLRTIGT